MKSRRKHVFAINVFLFRIQICRMVSSLLFISFRKSFQHCSTHTDRDYQPSPCSRTAMLPKNKIPIGLVSMLNSWSWIPDWTDIPFYHLWTFVLELPASSGSQTPDSTLCFPAMKFRITSGSAIVAALRHLRTSFSLQPALWKRHRWIFHKIY